MFPKNRARRAEFPARPPGTHFRAKTPNLRAANPASPHISRPDSPIQRRSHRSHSALRTTGTHRATTIRIWVHLGHLWLLLLFLPATTDATSPQSKKPGRRKATKVPGPANPTRSSVVVFAPRHRTEPSFSPSRPSRQRAPTALHTLHAPPQASAPSAPARQNTAAGWGGAINRCPRLGGPSPGFERSERRTLARERTNESVIPLRPARPRCSPENAEENQRPNAVTPV